MRRSHSDQPALITTAPESNDDEFDRRRKRYAIIMSVRALCVLAAALTYHVSPVIALLCILSAIPLPWCAVLIANDGPVKKRRKQVTYGGGSAERALPPGSDDRTVDG
jgi:hypothetical protein